jgi:DNA repair exonuclease SbcCD ATPase subunit
MIINSLHISNILSIKDATINFDTSGLVLLDGWNHDDDTANAAGKSSVFNALCYALYGKMPRKISNSEIIRKSSKKGQAAVTLQINNDIVTITRGRPKFLSIEINGITNDSISQEEIEEKIGLSYDQFLLTVYSSQMQGLNFISLNDSAKKDVILQMMNLESLFLKKKKSDAIAKELLNNLDSVERNILTLEAQVAVYIDSKCDIEDLRARLNQINTTGLECQLQSYQEIKKPDDAQFVMLSENLNRKLNDLRNQEIENKLVLGQIKQLDVQIAELKIQPHVISCPSCSEELTWSSDSAMSYDQYRNEIKQKIEYLKTRKILLLDSLVDLLDLDTQVASVKTMLEKIATQHRKIYDNYNAAQSSIFDIKNKIVKLNQQGEQLKDQIQRQVHLVDKLSNLNQQICKLKQNKDVLLTEIQLYKSISECLAPTGAPAYLMDTVIELFNSFISEYICHIWPSASYQLTTYKENSTGDIKAKFSEKLTISGSPCSIGSLSGGEYKSLSIAVDLALIAVVEHMFEKKINPLIFDEPFEWLDATNREKVINLMAKLSQNKQIWIIDHMSESKALFSQVLHMEKRSGISTLVVR